MCGRFALLATGEDVAAAFQLDETPLLAARYNIAPTQPVAAVRINPGTHRKELTHFQWGLIPSWSKDPGMGARMINARSETAADKPAFRSAFKYRRCIIPASGFYEWQKANGGKQPLYIYEHEHTLLGLAGLWEHWQSADGTEIESCTILTTTPSDFMAGIHNRMPVILEPPDYETWLYQDPAHTDQLLHLLRPAAEDLLTAYPVSKSVNSPSNDGPELIVPLA
jgi:putative SOS response-associated peptidase YedK